MESKKIIIFTILFIITVIVAITLICINIKNNTTNKQFQSDMQSENKSSNTQKDKNKANSESKEEPRTYIDVGNNNENVSIEINVQNDETVNNESNSNNISNLNSVATSNRRHTGQNSSGNAYVEDDTGNENVDIEIDNNGQTVTNTENTIYEGEDDSDDLNNFNVSNMKIEDTWRLDIVNNEYSKLEINLNLLNAPNNKEYCEFKLNQNYIVKLNNEKQEKYCSGYPTTVTFNSEGKLNELTHTYTKTGMVDFSNTKFKALGDYYFNICSETTEEVLYQVIVTLRSVTNESGYSTGKSYSLIQIKSLMQDGRKVDKISINIQNPNTYITLKKEKDVNGFWEKFNINLDIDGYSNESYTVLDGNVLDKLLEGTSKDNSSLNLGSHIVAIDENNKIISQTYKLASDAKIYIGRNYTFVDIKELAKIASIGSFKNLGIKLADKEISKESNMNYEIPVGTKYIVYKTPNKNYREKYEVVGMDFVHIAQENVNDNEIIIKNITGTNPKTGVFYIVFPFVIIGAFAIIGIVVMKKFSSKNKED